ncbi:MAG TPA: hypothetical protein PLT64_00335 [Syntrophales bacterium]|nr:hypothetical protein [Syntrophales bacterium]HOL58297.1 hypothetical protein [Syntrophales bacterium]HPO34466.1 hypothetical protein [Syntrophales bacterium]
MGRCFNSRELGIAAEAFYHAELLAYRHFGINGKDWKELRYDVKTLAQLKDHEVQEGAFAHLCRYEYERGHFYRICLQDSRILDAVLRAASFIKLSPLLLYIAAHELVHVIRFSRGEAEFDAPEDEKREEEARVHAITQNVLQSRMTGDLKLVLDCFSHRYQICQ